MEFRGDYLPRSTSAPLSSRCSPTLGGVPVAIPFATSNSTTGQGLSPARRLRRRTTPSETDD